MADKFVIVGGGSAYTPGICESLLREGDRFAGWELCLYDIAPEHLDIVGRLCRNLARAAGADLRVTWTGERAAALVGARFVLNQIRAGGLAARDLDERIPLRHGVIGQETVGPGGLAYAWRSIPACVAIARDVVRHAPEAWLLNYANPAGMVTEAVLRVVPGTRIIGLCDMPEGVQWALALLLRRSPERLRIDNSGINHCGWMRLHGGERDLTPLLRRWLGWLPAAWLPEHYAMPMLALLQRYGFIPSPYLRYYYFRERMVRLAQATRRTRAQVVQARLPRLYAHYERQARAERPRLRERRGLAVHGDLAVRVMSAMVGGHPERHVINQLNGSTVPGLPPDRVAEFPAEVSGEGFRPLPQPPLPEPLIGLVRQVKASEALAVDAGLTGDVALATAAVAASPLVPTQRVAGVLTQELLAAHRPHLPQFFAP